MIILDDLNPIKYIKNNISRDNKVIFKRLPCTEILI